TSLEEPPTDLELKPLPDNLEYVFLEEPSFLPVIISSQLSAQNKSKLVSVLKKYKEAFAWKTTYISGICPSFCKHKVQLLDDKKPVVQKQRRLNPNMQEVVKKEIMKLLDTAKLSQEPEPSLILSSEKVNADDTADKSSSRTFMLPVTQPKAPTDLKPKKKKILPSSKPKSSYKVRVVKLRATPDSIECLCLHLLPKSFVYSVSATQWMDDMKAQSDPLGHLHEELRILNNKIDQLESQSCPECDRMIFSLLLPSIVEKSSEKNVSDDEPPVKKLKFLIPTSSSILSPTPLKSILPEPTQKPEVTKMTLEQFTEHLTKTLSSIFSPAPLREPTPPRDPTPLKDETKGKGIATEEPLKEIMPYMEEGGSVPKIHSLKSFIILEGKLTNEDVMAQVKDVVNSSNEATMRITRGNDPLNVTIHDKSRLKTLGFSKWLECVLSQAKALGIPPPHEVSTFGDSINDRKRKRSSEILQEVFVKENVVVDGMHRNIIPPPGVEGRKGLVIRELKVMKGLSECEASESNVKRIQVKDIVKEVEDYLKTYLSAGMDISCWLSKFACKLDTLSSLLVQRISVIFLIDVLKEDTKVSSRQYVQTSFRDGLRESLSHLPTLTHSIILILVLSSFVEVCLRLWSSSSLVQDFSVCDSL
ncbi:hypothetical protein Tco_1561039, partial [Tanacetum coccineum]